MAGKTNDYDPSRTWAAKSLWTGTGKNRKPHPDAVAAFEYIHAHKIVKGTYKGNAHATERTTLPNAMRRHLPNVEGLSGKGTRQRISEWQAIVRPRKAASEAPATVEVPADKLEAFEKWQASQAG